MKKAVLFSFIAIFLATTSFATHSEAKRFGGGMSFGKSMSPPKNMSKPSPQQGLSSKPVAKPGAATPSRAGGMMGILGGLAMGGLLGALFFGGAFEGINFMDILLFAGIGFAIFWFMRRAAASRQQPAHAGHARYEQPSQAPFGQPTQSAPTHESFLGGEQTSTAIEKPIINEAQFLGAARDIFMRMQASWDAKNIDDIRAFASTEVANHIQAEMNELGDKTTKTEVGMLNAEISDSWIESDMEWVAVHFTAMLKEETFDAAGATIESSSTEANEFWIFQHQPNSEDPTWYLAGIQQS